MYSFVYRPSAIAYIQGGNMAPDLVGEVKFYQKRDFVLVEVRVSGLPVGGGSGFFGLHIHEGASCSGESFSKTGNHYNPTGAPHPRHAGDLPPLLLCNGGAHMAVKTDRFRVEEIIGRTVVIHSGADDIKSQPSGNAGEKIACGVIRHR